MNKLSKLKSFIITAIVTAIVVVVLCFTVELALLFKCENYITAHELNMANLVKFATIEQLEKRLLNEPRNHVVMIKLAKIRDELGESKAANKLYLSALRNSNRSNYALYSYAIFCAKHNLCVIAASLAEEIIGNNKKSVRYKSEIYEAIGSSMMNTNQYQAAVKAYQISYKYAKNLKSIVYFNQIQKEFAASYVKLADYYIEQDKISEAITALNNSIKVKESQVAIYKLGLLYVDTDKKKAQKYIETVFNKEPYVVNPYIYNSLLQDLIQKATDDNNQSALNYYSVKYDRFKNAMENIYLYKDDIIIDNAVIKKEKEDYVLYFDLKNNTKTKIDQLYIYIDIFLNTRHYKITKKVVKLAHTLRPYEEFKDYSIVLPNDMDFVDIADHNYLILKFYAKKSVKAPNTLVKITALNF